MASDTRSLSFKSKDDAQRWRVLRAVEDTALHAAAQHGFETHVSMLVRHSGGQYRRASVAESKAAAERNGFLPEEMFLEVERRNRAEDGYYDDETWVEARLWSRNSARLVVSVEGNQEVEVNGVFAMIESAVTQAKRTSAASGKDAVPASRWRRVLNHPYSVQILGGAGAAAVVAAAITIWAYLR